MKHNSLFYFFKNMMTPKSRKGWIIRIIVIFILLFGFLAFRWLNCYLEEMYPNPGCATIQEAKERGVLLYMYKITPGSFILPDGRKVYFKEVWVEKGWRFTNVCKNEFELVPDSYYFNLTFNGKQTAINSRYYGPDWYFVRGNDNGINVEQSGDGKGNDRIQMHEDVAYPTDTLRLIVNSGPALSKETERVEQTFVVQKVTD